MASDDEIRQAAIREAGMKTMGLVVLLARAGGTVTYDQAEYDAILERYGGSTNMAVHIEIVSSGGGPPEVQLTLVRKPPANTELVS